MQEQTGSTYTSSKFAKALGVSEPKVGKSTFLIGAALGVLPWQKRGGIVSRPEDLHVVTVDANALGGVKRFLLETCKAPTEALNFHVYNLQEDFRQVSASQTDWDMGFYNTVQTTLLKVADRCKGGSSVLLMSSLTGIAVACERALAGPPVLGKKGAGMDMAKWGAFSHQLNEIRNFAQLDAWHCIWEAHIYKPPANPQDKDAPPPPESLQVSGKTGQNFAYNVEQVFRIRRSYGQKFEGTRVDLMCLDTQPSLDFIAGGRNFTEALQPREFDPTEAFEKLGLTVGHWGAKSPARKVIRKVVK